MSNSAKMTVEEMLVQKIKTDSLASIITDEDVLTKLAQRAIQEALFQPRRKESTGYGNWTELPSPVVTAATMIAQEIAMTIGEVLKKDQALMQAVREAIIIGLPNEIRNMNIGLVNDVLRKAGMDATNKILAFKHTGVQLDTDLVPTVYT